MKKYLGLISKRCCNLVCSMLLLRFLLPAPPGWLSGGAMIFAAVWLSFLLADEIVSRQQRARPL
jgi:hypothetical protein